ncbi:MAG TPA: hypothetical protein VJW20_07290 [Candidatus Angelobacter sp.]|nr:hypothetical protein [Candidatus Angelobacter sp.]
MNVKEGFERPESERQRLARHFHQVASTYVRIRSLSPMAAVNIDDESRPNLKLNAEAIHFAIDCERATAKALNNDPALLAQWQQLAEGTTQVPDAAKITHRCGRIYEQRRLIPHRYFQRIKRGVPGIPRVPLPVKVAA